MPGTGEIPDSQQGLEQVPGEILVENVLRPVALLYTLGKGESEPPMPKRIKQYKKDNLWVMEHFEELVDKYGGRFVAVARQKVTGVGRNPVEAENKSLRRCPHVLPSVLHVPQTKDFHAYCKI